MSETTDHPPLIEIKHRLTGAVLFSGRFGSLRIALSAAVEARANLEGAYLADAYLARANLEGAYLARANLEGAYLEGANLEGAYLADAYLARANLADAYLARADLAGANLEGAYLARADHVIPLGTPNGWSNAYAYHKDDILRVQIGCRNFTLAMGRGYWTGKDDRREVLAALDYAEAVAKLRGWEF